MKNENAQKSLFGRMADTAARWAANMMQCAGEEVRCYEEACQKLGGSSAVNPLPMKRLATPASTRPAASTTPTSPSSAKCSDFKVP